MRERYAYARDMWSPIFSLMREDLRFSDPTDLQQWPDEVRRERDYSRIFEILEPYYRQAAGRLTIVRRMISMARGAGISGCVASTGPS